MKTERKRRTLAEMTARLDRLTAKERVLIVASLLLSVAMAWQSLLIDPLAARKQTLLAAVTSAGDELRKIEAVSADLMAGAQVDPDASTRQLIAAREQELAALRERVEARVGRVVPPAQMAKVLETVLGRIRDLEFVGLEGLGVEPLVPVDAGAAAPAAPTALRDAKPVTPLVAAPPPRKTAYRHGIRIRFAGSYIATINYLRALEALPWGFFWDRVELETQDFPRVEGSIVVYTVSLEEGWIGV
ncbi:MAG: hypothetical protein AB7I32_11805 [Gammaproteobacteria bacterium]